MNTDSLSQIIVRVFHEYRRNPGLLLAELLGLAGVVIMPLVLLILTP